MIDITHKLSTLRIALAQAVVKVSKPETMLAIQQGKVPKGDVYSFAKAAALLAVKKTSDVIPDCHPMPVESTSVAFEIKELEIKIEVEVKTVYKTGVEVEAMHGASVAALTIYDMLKPIDKGVEIHKIKLLSKKGGKSDFSNELNANYSAAVVVCSDGVSEGKKEDISGLQICEKLQSLGLKDIAYSVVADEPGQITGQLNQHTKAGIRILIFTGGTGLSSRDITPDTVRPLLDREIPGIMEAARNYGMQRMPLAMLSRSLAGIKDNTLVLCLPGSSNAVKEYMDALFPFVLHVFPILSGEGHASTG